MLQKLLFFTLIFCVSQNLFSQRKLSGNVKLSEEDKLLSDGDSLNNGRTKVILSGKTKYTDYKIINHFKDTTIVDTTLTIKKYYKFNYLRKDNFGLMQFHNQGQTYNTLVYDFEDIALLPDIGFSAKQFSFFDVEDVNYYQVPTSTSEITYKTGLEQGQFVDAIFTTNFSKRFNMSISYKGLRSLGAYRRSLVSNGNFRTTFSYTSPSYRYELRSHYVSQDFFHQENGGLTASALTNFTTNNPDFTTRARLDVNLNDAENQFDAKRLYINHSYKLFSVKDSAKTKDFTNLKLGHILNLTNKKYLFIQGTTTTSIFGSANPSAATNRYATYNVTDNQFNLEFNSKYVLGTITAKANFTNLTYGYDEILNTNTNLNRIKLDASALSLGADWKAKLGKFSLVADAKLTPGNTELAGSHLKVAASFEKDSLFSFKAHALLSSKTPNFNMIIHQSRYDAYNWSNNFERENVRNLGADFASKWINASANFTNIDNYTYFDENATPQQYANQITYLKIKVNREFRFGTFALDNTILYQSVTSGNEVYRVPELVTRNTLYYTDYWFKNNPLLAQIGVSFNYFSTYKMNAYNPILAEFTLQNSTEIGFPRVDVFFNAQVRRTRIFFGIDNILSKFSSDKNYFSAPNYPYRDFTVRFGLVWNWFI